MNGHCVRRSGVFICFLAFSFSSRVLGIKLKVSSSTVATRLYLGNRTFLRNYRIDSD